MEAVRKIVNASLLAPIINLPWKAKGLQVEVIVMPVNDTTESAHSSGTSIKGCLKAYANIALTEQEKHAWKEHAAEKYGAL